MDVKVGDIVQGPSWDQPVEIVRIELINDGYVRVVGKKTHTGETFDDILTIEEMQSLTVERTDGDSMPLR